jgi:hypothetical protein
MSQRTSILTNANQATEGRAVRSVEPVIHLLEPEKYPITVLLTKAEGRLKSAGNYKVEMIEDELPAMFDVLGGDLTSGASTMTVTNYAYFVKNMLVRVNKAEIVRVTATPTTTSVSISRAVGETSAAAATNGDSLEIIGESYEEGAPAGDIVSTVKTNPYNYMDITRTQFGWTGRAMNSEVYGQADAEYERYKKAIEHARVIEKKIIMSERSSSSSGGVDSKAHTTMRGVLKWITTNVVDGGGEFTEAKMDSVCLKAFRYGSPKKLLVACGTMINAINGFAKQRIKTGSMDSRYGLALNEYINAFGNLDLQYHQELANDDIDDTTGLGGTGIILDIGKMNMHHMPNRYMVHNTDIQTPGYDTKQEEFLSDCTITLALEKEHAVVTGVTS